jgi:hypothetical protein
MSVARPDRVGHRGARRIVLWQAAPAGMDGQPRVRPPREINVRLRLNLQASGAPQGGSETEDATAQIDFQVPLSSLVWLGSLEALDLQNLAGLLVVTRYAEVPDPKGRFVTREIGLRRYSSRLPAVLP